MLEDLLKQFSLQVLAGAIRQDLPEEMRRQFAEAFWQVTYLQQLEILNLLPSDFPAPPLSSRSPSASMSELQLQEVLLEIVALYARGETLEPPLRQVLQNDVLRLTAAQTLAQRLTHALQRLNQQITQLEE